MVKDNAGGKQPLFRLMVTENKDKEFDEIKFVLSFRGMFDGSPSSSFISSSSSSSSPAPLTFPSSLEELVTRTRGILSTLDELQAQDLKTPTSTDSSKNKEVADCMQRLHRELELYQYIYSRIVRVESLLLLVEEMKKVLPTVVFLKEYSVFLVEFCLKAAELTKEKLTYIRYSGKGKSQTIRDFVTTDHYLLLQENFTLALSFLKLCSKKRASFSTLLFENESDGLSSPPNNVIRRLLTVLGTVGIGESNLDFSHVEQRELEQNYQNGLFEAVSEFLKNPKEELKKEFLIRLQDDLNTLSKSRKSLGASQQLVSVSQELHRILEWVSQHEAVLGDVVSSKVDAVLKEKEELKKEKEKEKENLDASFYGQKEETAVEKDMSDVFYNHVAWTDLNVLQEIGQGAFALVYEAELAGERVAVKKIKEDQKDARTQLFNEVRVMSQLRSSFVVELYGASLRQQSQTIMVMEYLPRGAIFDVLQNPEERISWKMKWKFALEMAEGLNYIHTRHPPIVHRDLKTANFLLSEGWRVKLCDFGLAIPLFPPPPAENCGTVRWTAPEINDSQVYTTKSDVYSYGIILWEVAAREIPWKEETNDSTIKRVAKGDRPQVPPETPISYEMLMRECWSHKAENRPSFASILQQLKRWGIMEWVESLQGEDNFEKIKIESKKLEAKAKDQSQQRSEMENRQNEADAKVRNMQRLKRDLKIEKDDAERRQREYNQKNTQLERQITVHQQKLHEVEKQIRVYEARVEDTRKSIQEEREEATSQLNEEIEEVRKKIAEDEIAVKELQEKKKALEEKKQEINRQLTSSASSGAGRTLTPTRQRF